MSTSGKIFLGVLLVLAAFVWVASVRPVFAVSPIPGVGTSTAPLSVDLNQYTAGAIAARSTTLPEFDETGIIFMDTTKTPAAPYIAYENAKYQLMTHTLIFNYSRGCDVSAGELPCAPSIGSTHSSETDPAPFPAGTLMHVAGGLSDQAVIVQSYSTVPSLASNIVQFSTPVGSPVRLSNGLELNPQSVQDNASCTFGIGCFGNGVDRLQTVVSDATATTTTDLIPGTVYEFGNSSILLLSLTGSVGQQSANFLVSSSK